MRIPIASDGYKFIVPSLLASGLFLWLYPPVGIIFSLGALFLLFFFRDPERTTPKIENAVFAAGDGLVDDIEEVDMPDFPSGKALKVGVFLSLFNCHITRAATGGKIRKIQYEPGKFYSAMRKCSSMENENNSVLMETDKGPIMVRQIAGAIARRIVCTAHIGQQISAGERLGLIRMGSRVEVYVPIDAELRVKKGAVVHAGQSVLAILKD